MSDQKVVIITGASQGIGAGLVEAYRKIGYAVVANSRSIKPSDDQYVVAVAGDIADPATAENIVTTALERFGRIDSLVNNAGIFTAKPFTDFTAEDYKNNIGINLGGFFYLTQRVIAQLLKQGGGGHVVNVTTTLVESANSAIPSVLASVTKGGLAAATKSLAIEYAARGIRVNAVSPGFIDTPIQGGATPEQLAQLHPNKRTGTVEDIARGVIYLEESPLVTGEFLHVDGGLSAGR
ncbi:SDR family NAD(P)-dependent oxidoreductase [Nonomuraea jiangxiensis]|uniref:NAD(P)-dependent dehydrogenase, short-chain alcohol dehydrogenase family n=1 Tax=Nonomuraea jiangxiensis TaxID=633440 RepID=A0A1G8BTX5_9ACTN|nr:SDR family oxidoreductase [Nonomuraea jiangxiensis]SDH36675.1 NAD(P)-dependent dehydrogenase, short-chain alcohol dehydrogenase family [Nonomuraea jiangxiensis]